MAQMINAKRESVQKSRDVTKYKDGNCGSRTSYTDTETYFETETTGYRVEQSVLKGLILTVSPVISMTSVFRLTTGMLACESNSIWLREM